MTPQPFGARALGRAFLGCTDAFATGLEELALGVVRERNVEPVDPGHRLGCRVVLSVPVPARLRQEVAARHADRIAVDYGPDPLTLDDEAEGMLGVAVL